MNTEPLIVQASSVVGAWTQAATILAERGDRFNLTVHITDPAHSPESEAARFCHRRVAPNIRQSVYDVANTIFPVDSVRHGGNLADFFSYYEKVYLRGQARHPSTWGTYFLRLIRFGANRKNQLDVILRAMTTWNSKPRAAFVVHLSSSEVDAPRHMGAPCWQYAQFIRNGDNVLSMSAVYRSHDYFQKALGNFLGLTRLLRFVSARSGMTPGTLTCLSTYASLQDSQVKTRQLLRL